MVKKSAQYAAIKAYRNLEYFCLVIEIQSLKFLILSISFNLTFLVNLTLPAGAGKPERSSGLTAPAGWLY